MRKQTRIVLLALPAAIVLFFGGADSRAGAHVSRLRPPDLVRIIETPKPPAARPAGIRPRDWELNREEAWIRYRYDARKELARRGAPAVEPILKLLARAKRVSVRVNALLCLADMKPDDLGPAGPAMVRLLSDPNPGIRYLAAKVAGRIGYRPAVPVLQKMAEDKEPVARMAAADALGRIGDFRAAQTLVRLLSDKNKEVRLHAIEAVGRLGAAMATVPALTKKLESNDINERNAAIAAVKELLGYELTRDSRIYSPFPNRRQPVINDFTKWWKSNFDAPRWPITNELTLRVNIAHRNRVPQGIRLSRATLLKIRLKALEVVGRTRDPAAVHYLRLLMMRENPEIRKAAARAAAGISGIRIEYAGTETETEWQQKIRNFWKEWERIRR